jgi:hypothetical protein
MNITEAAKSLTGVVIEKSEIENFKEETTIGGINTNNKTCVK